jgi:hypothetical protein
MMHSAMMTAEQWILQPLLAAEVESLTGMVLARWAAGVAARAWCEEARP